MVMVVVMVVMVMMAMINIGANIARSEEAERQPICHGEHTLGR